MNFSNINYRFDSCSGLFLLQIYSFFIAFLTSSHSQVQAEASFVIDVLQPEFGRLFVGKYQKIVRQR